VGRGGARWGAAEDAARARRREELPLLFRVAVRACAREEDDEACWPARVDSVALDPICLGALLCVGCGFDGRFEGSMQPSPCKQQGTGSQSRRRAVPVPRDAVPAIDGGHGGEWGPRGHV
jgi:hypothetical protein